MMSSLLQQLENNEAILLMYLAGELPEADQAEVRQMLASDPGLRSALAEMAMLQDDVTGALIAADASRPLNRRDIAARQVSRAMAAARLEGQRMQPAATRSGRPRLRIAWWAYPIAAAAMLTVAMTLFSGNRPVPITPTDPMGPTQYVMGTGPAETPTEIIPSPDDLRPGLTNLESQLLSIQSRGNDMDLFGGTPEVDQ